jgi:hypothetical protein
MSQLTLVLPTDLGGSASSAPLGGSYVIKCGDPDPANAGVVHQTREIKYNTWKASIEHILQQDMPFLSSKIIVEDLGVKDQSYWENARRFAIVFEGMDANMPQCELVSAINDPITGENVVFEAMTLAEFGENLIFEPIPQEMLYTAATRPQVLVNVDGISAACANLDCDYLYVDTTAQVTGQSLSGNTLTITGTDLPTDLLDVKLGDVGCGPTTGTSTSITCNLLKGAAAGTYPKVEVISVDGVVPLSFTAMPISVTLQTIGFSPNTNLSQDGGDVITIQGSGLPQRIDQVDVTFSDNSKCTVISVSDTEIQCITDGFDPALIDTTNPYSATIVVNGV